MCFGVLIGMAKPVENEKSIFGLPSWPLLVVTMMTPLAPLAPNTAVAEASFSTEILATSLGSMVEKSRSTPSTSTSGLELLKLDTPRMRISESLSPGCPEVWSVVTPESLPARALVIFDTPASTRASPLTCEMAPTTLSLRCTP